MPAFNFIAAHTLPTTTASYSFTAIPQTYNDLLLYVVAKSTRTSFADLKITFNSSGSYLFARRMFGDGTNVGTDSSLHTNMTADFAGAANTFTNVEIYIPNYTLSRYKAFRTNNASPVNASSFNTIANSVWSDNTAITSLQIFDASSNNLLAGSSFYLYGINNS